MVFLAAAYTSLDIAVAIVGLIILWLIISIPVWLAGKAVTGGKASIGEAMLATLAGPIVYYIVALLVDFFLGAVIGSSAWVFAYILALLAWIWVFKASFKTGWLQAVLIAVLAWIIFVVLSSLFSALFGVGFPGPFFPKI